MFHSRCFNNKINSMHERITYQDNKSTFQDLQKKYDSVSIHHGNLKIWQQNIYKITKIHQKYWEKHLRPKQVRIIFREKILLKDVQWTLYITVLNRYRFRSTNVGFSSCRIETIREPCLLQIENKELDTLLMSMQIW